MPSEVTQVVNKPRALRGPGKSYSDVIIRLAAVGHESLNL
jgi:hypothetical protein